MTWTSKSFVTWIYGKVTECYPMPEFVFMNLGYSELPPYSSNIILNKEDELDHLSIQLYHHLISRINLEGSDVLEIGCGRGGGSSYIMRYIKPKSVIAVDLSPKAIELCQASHNINGLTFKCADAEHLPFEDKKFDVIVNIESSHCYPSMNGSVIEKSRNFGKVINLESIISFN